MKIQHIKKAVQISILRSICKQISESDNETLEMNGEDLLIAITDVLENQSCEDAWGTEGWEHYFGVE